VAGESDVRGFEGEDFEEGGSVRLLAAICGASALAMLFAWMFRAFHVNPNFEDAAYMAWGVCMGGWLGWNFPWFDDFEDRL
jgi:hypothetical protein